MNDIEKTDNYIELSKLKDKLGEFVKREFDLPDPALKLDMNERKSDKKRTFKYLHQMCWMHVEHYKCANRIKLIYLLDGYLHMMKSMNPIGVYMFARSLLEMDAFTYEITKRLSSIKDKPLEQWVSKGQEFFGNIVRARYGGTHPEILEILGDLISPKNTKPFNVMACIKSLSAADDRLDITEEYEKLCDVVHHNFSSQIMSASGCYEAESIIDKNTGGTVVLKEKSGVTRYKYPSTSKAEGGNEFTHPLVMKYTKSIVRNLNVTPENPFSQSQVIEFTGSVFGIDILNTSEQPAPVKSGKVGRNVLCPCGSGMKFKRCCLKDGLP